MSLAFVPDIGACRLCGATTGQQEFWREIFMGAGQSLRLCGYCAALYLGPDFTPSALDDFYAHHYRRLFLTEIIGKKPASFFKQRFESRIAEERLRIAAPLLPTDGKLFELGSGFGGFLGAVAKARPDAALYAAEHDATHRSRLCEGAQVQWITRFEDFSTEAYFDVIAAFHVLEHLPRPVAFARWAACTLRPGGHLLVEVPDASAGWRTRKFVHPAHLTYFTPHTLRRTLQSAGFDVIRCGGHPAGEAFGGTLLALARRPAGGAIPCAMPPAAPEEITGMARHVTSLRWTLGDRLKTHAKRAATKTLGPERTGALQRWIEYRRLKKRWND